MTDQEPQTLTPLEQQLAYHLRRRWHWCLTCANLTSRPADEWFWRAREVIRLMTWAREAPWRHDEWIVSERTQNGEAAWTSSERLKPLSMPPDDWEPEAKPR